MIVKRTDLTLAERLYFPALIGGSARTLDTLRDGAVVGTASLRRGALVRRKRPDLKVVTFRGNVHSRLEKLARSEVDATLLALAGLTRLGLGSHATEIMDEEAFPPALGQGAAHPPEPAPLQHRQIAVDQPRCRRRCRAAEIALLEQDHPQAAACRIAREADTVQAAADDREVVIRHEAVEKEQSAPSSLEPFPFRENSERGSRFLF